jgi:hypothetical protein
VGIQAYRFPCSPSATWLHVEQKPPDLFNKGMKLRKMSPVHMCWLLAAADSKLLHITENNCNRQSNNRIAVKESLTTLERTHYLKTGV